MDSRRIFHRRELGILSLLILIVYGGYLWFHWPGIFQFDIINALKFFHINEPFPWMSFTFSYIAIAFYNISPHPFLPLAFTIVVYAGVFYYFFDYMLKNQHLKIFHARLFFALFCFWPYMVFNALELDRAIYAALFFVLLAVYYIVRAQSKKPLTRLPLLEASSVGMLMVATAETRQDSLLLMAVLPVAIFLKCRFAKKEWLAFALSGALSFYVLFVLLPDEYVIRNERLKYQITAVINPLSEMIYRGREITALSADEQARLSEYVDMAWIKENSDYFNMWVFHYNRMNYEKIFQNWTDFRFLTFKMFLKNWDIYLLNRGRLFLGHFGVFNVHFLYDDTLSSPNNPVLQYAPLYNLNRNEATRQRVQWVRAHYFAVNEFRPARLLLFSLFLSFVQAVLVLIFWRSAPISALAIAIVWQRYLVLLLLSPAPLAKYFFPMVPATLFIFFFALAESGFTAQSIVRRWRRT